jgi:hypothetical protein
MPFFSVLLGSINNSREFLTTPKVAASAVECRSVSLNRCLDADPGIASQLNGIVGVCNHSSTQAKVVLGDRIRDTDSRKSVRSALSHTVPPTSRLPGGCLVMAGWGLLPRIADHPRAVSTRSLCGCRRCCTGHLLSRRQRAFMENHPVDTEPILHLPKAEGKESLFYRHQDPSSVGKRGENALCLYVAIHSQR